jgi:hypothetical protein
MLLSFEPSGQIPHEKCQQQQNSINDEQDYPKSLRLEKQSDAVYRCKKSDHSEKRQASIIVLHKPKWSNDKPHRLPLWQDGERKGNYEKS